jgi:hypothetical protein
MTENPNLPPPPACERCGRESAVVIDGRGWCVDCWAAAGSCCAGEFESTFTDPPASGG